MLQDLYNLIKKRYNSFNITFIFLGSNRLAYTNSGVSLSAVLPMTPTIVIPAPIKKAIRQLKPNEVTKEAKHNAPKPPNIQKLSKVAIVGYCTGGLINSVKYTSAPITFPIEDMPCAIRHAIVTHVATIPVSS